MSKVPSDPEYVLRGVAGTVFGHSYHLLAPTTVGRAPDCDIYLGDRNVSRRHARLRPLDYGVEIEDLKSTNGSFLNGQRVTVGIARAGDEIAFDQLRFRVSELRKPGESSAGIPARTPSRSSLQWPWAVAALAILSVLTVFAIQWLRSPGGS